MRIIFVAALLAAASQAIRVHEAPDMHAEANSAGIKAKAKKMYNGIPAGTGSEAANIALDAGGNIVKLMNGKYDGAFGLAKNVIAGGKLGVKAAKGAMGIKAQTGSGKHGWLVQKV